MEPLRSRWKRRAQAIPIMLGATIAGVLGLPFVVLGTAAVDVLTGRWRFPTVRVALFLALYGIADSVEILLAPALWLAAGFGTRLHGSTSLARHERVQGWSLSVLSRAAETLLGLRVALDGASTAVLEPGPVIVLCRHVNLVDASLPSLLYQRLGYRTRGVIMAELLADPGFDLIYGRTGSVFITRDNGPEALMQVSTLATGVDDRSAVIIFPEGRLFRPDVRERSLARLAGSDPARAARLAGLRHVLPPRPGGVGVLLDILPSADVVVLAHCGLDRFPTFRELAAAVPLREPVAVRAWRTPATSIPTDPAARVRWLDDQWLAVDAWVGSQAATSERTVRAGTPGRPPG